MGRTSARAGACRWHLRAALLGLAVLAAAVPAPPALAGTRRFPAPGGTAESRPSETGENEPGAAKSLSTRAAEAPPVAAPETSPSETGEEDDGVFAFPGFRLAMGPSFHDPGVDEGDTTYALDLAFGLRFGACALDCTTWMGRAEIGYAFDSVGPDSHLFVAGIGPIVFSPVVSAMLYPRFIVGTQGDRAIYGLRSGILVEFLWGLIGVELSHQVAFGAGAPQHEVRAMVSVDLIAGFLLTVFLMVGL